MTDDNIVYQANPLVEAVKYDKADENKLFLLCLQGLNPHFKNSKYYDNDFKDTIIPTNKLIELFGNNYYYHALVEISKKLLDTKILIFDNEKRTFRGYNVFEYIEFGKAFGGLHYKFTNSMKPFLLDLYDKGYVGIDIKEIFSFNSSYALRILELLLQYKGYAKDGKYLREFSIDKLRIYLKVPPQAYKQPSSFIAYVIKDPVEQINIKTRYKIDYTIQRKGKKAIGITFQVTLPQDMPITETIDVDVIESKSKPKKEEISATQTPVEYIPVEPPSRENNFIKTEESEQHETNKPKKKLNDYTNEELKMLKRLLEVKLNKDTALELVDECGIKAIEKAFKEMDQTRKKGILIENPAGFIRYKTYEYFNSETEISEEDIFARVAEIEENERRERIRQKEEAEWQKAENNVKEKERKANRLSWEDWEIQVLAKSYIRNGKTFVNADVKAIEGRGWKPEEILHTKEYMQYFYPDSEVLQHLAKNK